MEIISSYDKINFLSLQKLLKQLFKTIDQSHFNQSHVIINAYAYIINATNSLKGINI